MNYLITGGSGFIGAHFIHYILSTDSNIQSVVNVDKLTPISNSFISERYAEDERYDERGITTDIADADWADCLNGWMPDIVVHFAAESHVDRSCENLLPFITSNIIGTSNIVHFCAYHNIPMIYISTDEVYGSLGEFQYPFTEESPIDPRNPYAATKASGEFILKSLANVEGYVQYAITRCSNNFGPLQDESKLIPAFIMNTLKGEQPFGVYGTGKEIRDWIYVEDHCSGIHTIAKNMLTSDIKKPMVFNVGADNEMSNIDLMILMCEMMEVDPKKALKFVDDPRGNAHDFRYAIDSSKLKEEFGWTADKTYLFKEALRNTIDWYENVNKILTDKTYLFKEALRNTIDWYEKGNK